MSCLENVATGSVSGEVSGEGSSSGEGSGSGSESELASACASSAARERGWEEAMGVSLSSRAVNEVMEVGVARTRPLDDRGIMDSRAGTWRCFGGEAGLRLR
jgi:hypothetical protein